MHEEILHEETKNVFGTNASMSDLVLVLNSTRLSRRLLIGIIPINR
jgi:hypothetical protein